MHSVGVDMDVDVYVGVDVGVYEDQNARAMPGKQRYWCSLARTSTEGWEKAREKSRFAGYWSEEFPEQPP